MGGAGFKQLYPAQAGGRRHADIVAAVTEAADVVSPAVQLRRFTDNSASVGVADGDGGDLRGSQREAGDLGRGQAVAGAGRCYLLIAVIAPAVQVTVADDRTGMGVAGGDGRCHRRKGHLHRHLLHGVVALPKLPAPVRAPAPDFAGVGESAGELGLGGEPDNLARPGPGNLHRSAGGGCIAVTEAVAGAVAPAPGRAFHQGAGVGVACHYLGYLLTRHPVRRDGDR